MSHNSPQVTFTKENFIFWKDTTINGTILVPDFDVWAITKIQVKHIIRYGLIYKVDGKPGEFRDSKEKILSRLDISPALPTFSLPILYPNIQSTDGKVFYWDGDSFAMQNIILITLVGKSRLPFANDPIEIIIPIEWPTLSDNAIDTNWMNEESLIDEEAGINQVETTKKWSILLPWKNEYWENDIVSEKFYNNILEAYFFARFWNTLYRHIFFIVLYYLAAAGVCLSILILIFFWGNFASSNSVSVLLGSNFTYFADIAIGVIIVSFTYLWLQGIPKRYLQGKMKLEKQLSTKSWVKLSELFMKDCVAVKDIFKESELTRSNPILWEKWSITIRFQLSHEFPIYKQNFHIQMLFDETIFEVDFTSFRDILEHELKIPKWLNEMLMISDAYSIWFDKNLCIYLKFDNFPDNDYIVSIKNNAK